jgi:hypothetical protein
MSARSLSFASLLLAAAPPVLAAEPTNAVVTASDSAAAPAVTGKWSQSVKDGELVLKLTLANTGHEAVDVMVARGKMPGTDVQASIDGVALARVFSDEEMSGQMSRMGPMPRFAPVAANKQLDAGTFRFTLPEGYHGEAVHVEARVRTESGEVPLRTDLNQPLGA